MENDPGGVSAPNPSQPPPVRVPLMQLGAPVVGEVDAHMPPPEQLQEAAEQAGPITDQPTGRNKSLRRTALLRLFWLRPQR